MYATEATTQESVDKVTMITVRMNPALKKRLDDRVKREARARRKLSLNRLCVQALVSVLDQFDSAEEAGY